MSKKINLDLARLLAAFLIVSIHTSPFVKINKSFDIFFTRILGRVAVPLFLMITGYYLLEKSLKDKKILKDYTKKILKIYLFCILLYLPLNIYTGKLKTINIVTIIKDILINGTVYHLWYFPALITGLWLTYYLIKKLGTKKTFLIVIILYLIGLLGDSYYYLVIRNSLIKNFYHYIFTICDYTRNGLFFTPIFIYLGYKIKKAKQNKSKNTLKIPLFSILMTLEAALIHYYNIEKHDSMYLFLIPLMYYLFTTLIEKSKTENKKLRKIATGIYIFHPLFIVGIRMIAKILKLEKILIENNLILYIAVCLSTFVFMLVIEKIKEMQKNVRRSYKRPRMARN